uniref:Tyr recombinase domain-containing protein n=1 Tax=Photinus pyralis TaxID=7054 RepID=A0A1Y1K5T2_PHOPY
MKLPKCSIETMIKSLSESTLNQYNSTYKLWWKFCNTKHISPLLGRTEDAIEFLQLLLEQGKYKYSTINAHRSALSLILQDKVGEDFRMKRFMRGVAKLRPSAPKYDFTWEPATVLKHLENIATSEDATLKDLSMKLITLLALSTGHRLQSLSLIRIENINITPDQVQILIPDTIKTSGPGKPQPHLQIPFFRTNPNLCVASTLIWYLKRTKGWRESNKGPLFLTFKKPHKKASKQSLSRWVKGTLHAAGIDVTQFKPHSTRHASTSLAKRLGLNIDTIHKSAGWSEKSRTFAKFYDRPVQPTQNFTNTIISSLS